LLFFFINAKIAQYDIAALLLIFQKKREKKTDSVFGATADISHQIRVASAAGRKNRFCIWSHHRHISSDQSCLGRQRKQILGMEPPQTSLGRQPREQILCL